MSGLTMIGLDGSAGWDVPYLDIAGPRARCKILAVWREANLGQWTLVSDLGAIDREGLVKSRKHRCCIAMGHVNVL